MSYFPPHFMMAGRQDMPENLVANGASAYAAAAKHVSNPWWLNYDQALDLQAPQQHKPMQMPVQIKHEHIPDQGQRYGFDQVNCSAGQPSSLKSQPPEPQPPPEKRKYPCEQCSYVATQKSSLIRHKQTQHEGIRPNKPVDMGKVHACDLCPSTFSQLCSLNRHKMAKHSGVQYNCDQCDYVGTTALNTKLHKRSKHEGVRYPCDICGYQATQSGVLNRHKVQKHGMPPNESRAHNNRSISKNFRDPNAPKRPLSGFFHFSNVGRAKIKEANPDFTVADISKELSRRWHDLDEVTRSMFEEMADNDKARFQREKAEYNMNPNGRFKHSRSKRDPNAPKRPLCGFMYFSAEERGKVRQENPNFAVGQIGKELGRRWAEADPEVRAKFNAMATEDKARFSKEKHEYQMTPYAGQWKGMRAKKDPNAPKRSVHAFMWYSNDNRASIRVDSPNASVGEVAKVLSARWAVETPEVKAKYEQMAFQDKQRYEKEKHEWHMSQREATIAQQAARQPQHSPQYKPEPQAQVQYKPEPQSQPQSQAPTPTPQQSQAPTPTPQQSQPAPIAQRTITPSSSSYNPPKQHQWTQPPQVPSSHQHSGLLPPISHVHPQSPPIAIHHNVPAPSIRYGY